MNYGRKLSQQRADLRAQKEREELNELRRISQSRKEELAKYPWINEELNQRKEDCCERLFLDALKRLGLPPPARRVNLLDEELFPSIYDKICRPTVTGTPLGHRKTGSRDSRTSKALSLLKSDSQTNRPFED